MQPDRRGGRALRDLAQAARHRSRRRHRQTSLELRSEQGKGVIGKVRNRGITYWGEKDDRCIFVVVRQYLYALGAGTGRSIPSFGDAGGVDLREGLGRNPETLPVNQDDKIRTLDKATGKLLWEATLPAGANATPATHEVDGRQFVVIAAGGGRSGAPSGGTYVAFALPQQK